MSTLIRIQQMLTLIFHSIFIQRENYDLIDSDNVVQGIKGLVSNLKELIEMIYDCVHKKDTKMKFGLTSLSHYVIIYLFVQLHTHCHSLGFLDRRGV